MIRLLLILLFGLTCESIGIVFLKKGINSIGEAAVISLPEILRLLRDGATNPQVLLGIFFEAVFFGCLLVLMKRSDISFLWPLTALSFVFATFAAIWFLGEKVSSMRWIGVVLIMIGAGFISYSEHAKSRTAATDASKVPEIKQ